MPWLRCRSGEVAWVPVAVVCAAACLLLPARLRADKAAWIVPGLAAALEDPNLEVRVYALGLVADFDHPAFTSLVVPHMAAAEPVVRKAAVEALQPIVPLPAEALEAMASLASDPVLEIRLAALAALKDRPLTPAACALVADGFKALDSATRFAALEALAGSASSASGLAPQLVPLLSDPDSKVRREAVVVLDASGGARQAIPGLVALLEDKAQPQEVRLAVAETLGHLGSEGRAAVPALVQAASDEDGDMREAAALALGDLGPVARKEAIEPLALALPYSGRFVGAPFDQESLDRLTALGEDALRKAAALWASRLQDPSPEVRSRALRALAVLGTSAEAWSDAAARLLQDPASSVRRDAVHTVTRLHAAERFRLELESLLLDSDPYVRGQVINALGNLGGARGLDVHQLVSFLRDSHQEVSFAAAGVLRSRKDLTPSDLTDFAEDLNSDSPKARASTLEILAWFGEFAKPFEARIAALLRDKDQYVRAQARRALLKLDADHPERRLARIREWLDGQDPEAHWTALAALQDLKEPAGPLIPSLERLLRIAHPSVKGTVSERLSEIGRAGDAEAVQAMANLLRGPDWQVQYHALKALAAMGKAAQPASQSVLETLASKRVSLRRAAFETLLAMTGSTWQEPPREGFPDEQARAVALLLRDPDGRLREAVFKELLRFGPLTANMAPVFIGLLADSDPGLRSMGAALLESVGKAAEPWHAAVSALLADGNPGVRTAGLRALTSPDLRDVDAVIGLLEDADPGVRSAAATVLGRFGPAAAAQAPRLVPLLQDPEPGVRWSALVGFQGLRSAPGEVLPQIVLRLVDPVPDVAQTANDTLWKLAPLDLEGVAALLELGYEHPSGGSSFRFLAHLLAGGNPEGELLIDWLDALATVPAGLDEPRAVALLDGLDAARPAVEPHRHLRSLLAERVAAVAAAVAWSSPEAVPVLRSHLAWLEERAPDKAAAVRAAVDDLENHGLLLDWFEVPAMSAGSLGEVLLDDAPAADLRVEVMSGRLRVRGSRSSVERLTDGLHQLRVKVGEKVEQIHFMKTKRDLFHLHDELVGGNFALLIGISHYQGNLRPLPEVLRQTRELGAVLQANGFDVAYLLDEWTPVTLKVVQRAVAELNEKMKARPNARLLFYFGGHGTAVSPPFGDPVAYLVVNGCNLNSPEDGCLSMDDIYDGRFSRYIAAKHVLFAIDACVASLGRLGDSGVVSKELMDLSLLQTLTEKPGRSVFTAGSGAKEVLDVEGKGGIFTSALIRAFRGEADQLSGDGNNVMTLGELEAFLKAHVNFEARSKSFSQVPGRVDIPPFGGGQFVFFQTAGRRRAP